MTETTTDTPAKVAALAQSKEKLPLNRLALIGLRATPQGNHALLRTVDGTILTVTAGDTTDAMTVTAVTETELHLVDAKGFARTLTMPG